MHFIPIPDANNLPEVIEVRSSDAFTVLVEHPIAADSRHHFPK